MKSSKKKNIRLSADSAVRKLFLIRKFRRPEQKNLFLELGFSVEESYFDSDPPPEQKNSLTLFLVLDFSAEELAQQITFLDWEDLSRIPVQELLSKRYAKASESPNLCNITSRINLVSLLFSRKFFFRSFFLYRLLFFCGAVFFFGKIKQKKSTKKKPVEVRRRTKSGKKKIP